MTLVERTSRLQRAPDFTGERLDRFRQVLLRHGLPGAALALLLLLFPQSRAALGEVLQPALMHPTMYLLAGLLVLCGLLAYAVTIDRCFVLAQLGWLLYLGALSFWEELAFRVALPVVLEGVGLDFWLAVTIANLIFGVVHYFTLRWRWHWCVVAFLGGLLLSRHLNHHQDLLLITAFHWIGTVLNTPRSPRPGP